VFPASGGSAVHTIQDDPIVSKAAALKEALGVVCDLIGGQRVII
jgi:hypothetical protein